MIMFDDKFFVGEICQEIRSAGMQLLKHQTDESWRRVIDADEVKTQADFIMNGLITDCLSNITPNVKIYSEETVHALQDRCRNYWLIDPIDGTSSWLSGFDGFVTQAALIEDNFPILGMIYHPASDRLWYNDMKGQVWCNSEQIKIPRAVPEKLRLIDNYPIPSGVAADFWRLPEIGEYIECGSLGLKSILTLVGEADLFVKSTIVRDWDIAPSLAIAHCLRGKMINKYGVNLNLGTDIEFNHGLIVSWHSEFALWASKIIRYTTDA